MDVFEEDGIYTIVTEWTIILNEALFDSEQLLTAWYWDSENDTYAELNQTDYSVSGDEVTIEGHVPEGDKAVWLRVLDPTDTEIYLDATDVTPRHIISPVIQDRFLGVETRSKNLTIEFKLSDYGPYELEDFDLISVYYGPNIYTLTRILDDPDDLTYTLDTSTGWLKVKGNLGSVWELLDETTKLFVELRDPTDTFEMDGVTILATLLVPRYQNRAIVVKEEVSEVVSSGNAMKAVNNFTLAIEGATAGTLTISTYRGLDNLRLASRFSATSLESMEINYSGTLTKRAVVTFDISQLIENWTQFPLERLQKLRIYKTSTLGARWVRCPFLHLDLEAKTISCQPGSFSVFSVTAPPPILNPRGNCPNMCSGHGMCERFCRCFPGYEGGDCSLRSCPMGLSWVDTPNGDLTHDGSTFSGDYGDPITPTYARKGTWEDTPALLYGFPEDIPFSRVKVGEGHFYGVCSKAGQCDHSTGLCKCYPGFEGRACDRISCPKDCSGHGVCRTVQESTRPDIYYNKWETQKMQRCECDGGWSGVDCSERVCLKGDDPLTTKGTRVGYNAGLPETGEVQLLEYSCPFGGTMRSKHVALLFTDPQFGDRYLTRTINLDDADAEAKITAALKGLPNEVLADFYTGETFVELVQSVSVSEEIADRLVYVTVTFNKRLGDVPLIQAVPQFKCKNGFSFTTWAGNESFAENIDVVTAGNADGPDFSFTVEGLINAAGDSIDYVVKDLSGNTLNNGDYATSAFPTGAALTDIETFDSSLDSLLWSFENGGTDGGRGGGEGMFTLTYHAEGVGRSNNILYTITGGLESNTAVTDVLTDSGTGTTPMVLTPNGAALTAVHTYYKLTVEDFDASAVRLYINDEFVGFGTVSTPDLEYSGSHFTHRRHPVEPLYLESGGAYQSANGGLAINAGGDSLVFYPTANLFTTTYEPVTGDAIQLTFASGAPYLPVSTFVLVVVVTDVSITATDDGYKWKIASDTTFSSESALPSSPAALTGASTYLDSHPDDDMRKVVPYLRFELGLGNNDDNRKCNTYYYAQVGTNGINDMPTCSGRGLCDTAKGLCKCFNGYTGLDCSEMNALANSDSNSESRAPISGSAAASRA